VDHKPNFNLARQASLTADRCQIKHLVISYISAIRPSHSVIPNR
jgi:hypothetical protein